MKQETLEEPNYNMKQEILDEMKKQETLKQSNKLEDSIIEEMSNDWETMSQQITFKQETLEEAIVNHSNDAIQQLSFLNGANWQQEKSYIDMQEYAMFCIECDRKEMPFLLVQDWYEHYKNK